MHIPVSKQVGQSTDVTHDWCKAAIAKGNFKHEEEIL